MYPEIISNKEVEYYISNRKNVELRRFFDITNTFLLFLDFYSAIVILPNLTLIKIDKPLYRIAMSLKDTI